MKITPYPSPNYDDRGTQGIDMLVLHYTGMPTAEAALERLCNPKSNVSAHYLVQEDGTVMQLVDESKRAWHAGISYWHGYTNINQRSIGIEIANPGHEFGYRPFPLVQMEALPDSGQKSGRAFRRSALTQRRPGRAVRLEIPRLARHRRIPASASTDWRKRKNAGLLRLRHHQHAPSHHRLPTPLPPKQNYRLLGS